MTQARTAAFVAVTAAVVGWELWAALRNDPRNRSWTALMVAHVPAPVAMTAALVLITWLPGHLERAYRHRPVPRLATPGPAQPCLATSDLTLPPGEAR